MAQIKFNGESYQASESEARAALDRLKELVPGGWCELIISNKDAGTEAVLRVSYEAPFTVHFGVEGTEASQRA